MQSIDGAFYATCECHKDIGLIEIDPSQLNHSKLNPNNLCLWLAKELGTDNQIKQEESLLWSIGKFDARGVSTHGYVFFSDSHDEVLAVSDKIKKRYSNHLVIWFGTAPITAITTQRLVSFWEMISIENNTLGIDLGCLLDRLSTSKYINSNFTLLDTHIALEKGGKQWYIYFERSGNEFKYQDKIKPQAARLIQHCFQIRNYSENAKTLEAFSTTGLAANKRTISSKIKEVNDLCKKRNQKPIFHKFENEKWGFNPGLGA